MSGYYEPIATRYEQLLRNCPAWKLADIAGSDSANVNKRLAALRLFDTARFDDHDADIMLSSIESILAHSTYKPLRAAARDVRETISDARNDWQDAHTRRCALVW